MNRKQIFGMLALVMLLASCNKDNQETEKLSFRATIERDGGKTNLDGTKVKWNEGNSIMVFDQTDFTATGKMFECGTPKEDGSADFVCEAPYPDNKGSYWAFYPFGKCTSRDGDKFYFTMPETQDYLSGTSFADDLFPMAAHVTGATTNVVNLEFKHAFGLMCVRAKGNYQITSIKLTSNNAEDKLWGDFSFDLTDEYETKNVSGGSNELTLNFANPVTLKTNEYKEFYFVLPPNTLTNGFSLDFMNEENVMKTQEVNPVEGTPLTVERKKKKTVQMTVTCRKVVNLLPEATTEHWKLDGLEYFADYNGSDAQSYHNDNGVEYNTKGEAYPGHPGYKGMLVYTTASGGQEGFYKTIQAVHLIEGHKYYVRWNTQTADINLNPIYNAEKIYECYWPSDGLGHHIPKATSPTSAMSYSFNGSTSETCDLINGEWQINSGILDNTNVETGNYELRFDVNYYGVAIFNNMCCPMLIDLTETYEDFGKEIPSLNELKNKVYFQGEILFEDWQNW